MTSFVEDNSSKLQNEKVRRVRNKHFFLYEQSESFHTKCHTFFLNMTLLYQINSKDTTKIIQCLNIRLLKAWTSDLCIYSYFIYS